jgi:cytochrome b
MNQTTHQVYVWDLPTRLFHWTLLLLIGFQWASAEIGGNLMDYHLLGGYAILALLLFRVLWGFVGSHYSRFVTFLSGIPATLGYLKSMKNGTAERHLGHNPLGGWMILALLALIGALGITGLFANDDVVTEGPLMHFISKEASDLLTAVHHVGFNILLALVALHVIAVYAHLVFKRENLIRPMFTGRKEGSPEQAGKVASPLLALVLLVLCGGAVAVLVKFAA